MILSSEAEKVEGTQRTLASSMPDMEASGLSSTRKAARLAVYEATMIMANPAHTIPSTRALKLRGVPVNRHNTD